MSLFDLCECETRYSIERHGKGYTLYIGRCPHRHGYNLVHLTEPAANCDFERLEMLLNIGSAVVDSKTG